VRCQDAVLPQCFKTLPEQRPWWGKPAPSSSVNVWPPSAAG